MIRRLASPPLVVALLAALLLAGAPAASAAPADDEDVLTWAVAPASAEGPDGRGLIEIVAEPGDVYLDRIAVRNLGTEPLTLELHGQDAVQTLEDAFRVLSPDEESHGVGSWLRLGADEVTVPPRGHVVVEVALDIPAGAEPGDHAGGIVAAATVAQPGGGTVRYQVGTRVHVRVAGPVEPALATNGLDARYEGVLDPFGAGSLAIATAIENTGTVRLRPVAGVRVSSLFGLWEGRAPLGDTGELLPGGAVAVAAELAGVPALGPLWIEVTFPSVESRGQDVTATTKVESATIVVWAVPWTLLVALLVLVLAAVLVAILLRRRRAAPRG